MPTPIVSLTLSTPYRSFRYYLENFAWASAYALAATYIPIMIFHLVAAQGLIRLDQWMYDNRDLPHEG